jgi:hypothetical protein
MGRVSNATPVRLLGFDQALVGVTLALLIWGLVMVYSASIAMPDNPKFSQYQHSHFFDAALDIAGPGPGDGSVGFSGATGCLGKDGALVVHCFAGVAGLGFAAFCG